MLRRAFACLLLLVAGCTEPEPSASTSSAQPPTVAVAQPTPEAKPAPAATKPGPAVKPAPEPAKPEPEPAKPAPAKPAPAKPAPEPAKPEPEPAKPRPEPKPAPKPEPAKPAPAPRPEPAKPALAPEPEPAKPALAAGEGRVEAVGDDEVEVEFAGATVGARLVALRDGRPIAALVVDEVDGDGVTAHVEATDGDLWVKPGDALRREEPAKGLVVKVTRVTVVARGLDVAAVLAQIGDQAQKDVALDDDAPNPKVTLELRDVPWDEAVLRVAKAAKLEALLDAAGALVAEPEGD